MIVLVCAIAASLALGVLLGHAVCLGVFRLLKMHAGHLAANQVSTTPTPVRLNTARN